MAEAQVGVRKQEGNKFIRVVRITVREQTVAVHCSHFRRLQRHGTLYSISQNYVTI
jgi:hypothetical protein